jgi:hypothetical protein
MYLLPLRPIRELLGNPALHRLEHGIGVITPALVLLGVELRRDSASWAGAQ